MSLRNNYQKLKLHLEKRGLIYAFWRGAKYFSFLVKNQKLRLQKVDKNVLAAGKLKMVCSPWGINIFWNNSLVTKGSGLNVAVNTLGLWTDSSKADWQIIEKGPDFFNIRVTFKELPLMQNWMIRIEADFRINWQISMEAEEHLYIDEIRILCPVSSCYKSWFNGYQQNDFPRLDAHWRDLCLKDQSSSLVGVRFPKDSRSLPSFYLEAQNDRKNFFPLVQNSSREFNSHIIGFRYRDEQRNRKYCPGRRHLFSGRINLFKEDNILDNKMEMLRQGDFKTAVQKKSKCRKSKRRLRVLLVNLPWKNEISWGVRAGSRWPHIKDYSEGAYLPFPFFLAYATSLLRKNGIEADLIDAIAEAMPQEKLLGKISKLNFDILVTETSVPSFYYDMQILKKISSLDMPIVLSGPLPEIYEPEFLKQNGFINFVLFGEYEFTLLELIKAISAGKKDLCSIQGLIWRNRSGDVVKNPARSPFDINLLPWPHRDGLPMDKYWDLPGNIPEPSIQMLASRGCPFSCNFCLWPQLLYGGRNYRSREVNDVVDEMEFMIRERGFKSVYFDDDTFNVGKKRIINLCDGIVRRGLHTTAWAVMAKADLMDEEILQAMKKAGVYAIKYGVESASQELLDRCGKCLNLQKAERMINFTKSLGIRTHLTFLFGLEGETEETMKKTIDYSLKLDPDSVQYSILTPFPGTEIFKKLDCEGRIVTKDWSLYDGHYNCVFQPRNLSASDLEAAKQYAYRLWAEKQRKKRGLSGDAKRFLRHCQNYGLKGALGKARSYLDYVYFKRKKFIGKI